MKWIKRLLIVFVGLLLSCVLILITAALFIQESHYKRLLAWGAERFLDSELLIEGPFEVDISRNLTLSSVDIQLKANNDSYQLSIGKMFVNFRLGSYLQSGSLWFNNLELEDINLEVKESAEDDFSFEGFSWSPVIIEEAQFKNLLVTYHEMSSGTSHKFSLDELTMDELGEHQPVSLRASGKFNDQPFELLGKTDSIAQLIEGMEPQDVQLKISSADINADIEGTIADPINGRGLDLNIQVNIPQVKDVIEVFWDEPPMLGSLKGSLSLLGDYSAPRLEEIDLHLQRGQQVKLTVRGSIDDAMSVNGLDLLLQGQSSDQQVNSWLLFNKYDRMQELHVNGKLQRNAALFSIHDLTASVKTVDEVKLQINGNAALHPQGHRLTKNDADLSVKFSAPTIATINQFNVEKIPELGPVSGSLEFAFGMDAIAIYNADVDIGKREESYINLKGDVGYVQLFEKLNLSELNLQTEIQTVEIARLGKQLDYSLPALGPAQLQGKLVTQGSELLLQGASLNIGTKGQSTLQASGLFATQLRELQKFRIAMDVDMQTTELAQLGLQIKYKLPALGPARLRGKLVTQGTELLLQGASLDIGTKEQSTLHAVGIFATQISDPKKFRVAMDVDIQANEFARLGDPFEFQLPELGPTHITGWLESTESVLHLKDGLLVVGPDEGQPTIRINFRSTTQLQKGSTINTNFDMALAELISAFTDLQPRNLGRLKGEALISDMDGSMGLESFNIATTQTNLLQWNMEGTYDDLVNYDEAIITTDLVIKSPAKLADALGVNIAGMGPAQMQGELNLMKGRLRFQGETKLGSTTSTTDISGYLKEGKPVFEGSFNIPVLHLADFAFGSEVTAITTVPNEQKPERLYVFSRDEFDVDFLNNFDFDLVVSIDEFESGELTIDSIKGNIKLSDGHFVGPLRLVFEGGNLDFNLDIKALNEPKYQLKMVADDVMLGPLLAQVQDQVPIRGYSNIYLNLQTSGRSPHKMASNLEGKFSLGIENARIPNHYLKLLSVDVFGWVLSGALKNTHADLNCVVMDFDVKQGEVMSAVIIADGPRLNIGGKINMNLGEETLDIVLIPKQKKRIFTSTSPVKISGPMKNPKVEAIPMRQAAQQIGSFAALGTGLIIPITLVSSVWSILDDGDKVGDGCDNLEKMAKAAKEKAIQQDAN